MNTFRTLISALETGIESPQTRRRAKGGQRRAGVLILFSDADDPTVTLTARASTLRSHAGQVSFPGGRMDPGDATVVDAALREAQEEVGLDPRLVTVLGELPTAWVPASRYDVTPVVGTWDGSMDLAVVDTAEVETVLQPCVSELVSPDARVMAAHPSGFTGPAFLVEGLMVWGFTGYLLDVVLRAGGWEEEWDADHVVDVPQRFLG